jgi:hypothetical protein
METDVDGVPFLRADSPGSTDRGTTMELAEKVEKVEDFEVHRLSKRERRIGCSNV